MDTIQFEFLARKTDDTHLHSDIELFFIMDGSGEFSLEDKKYNMKKEDFIVINPNQKHSFSTRDEKYLAASIYFPYTMLCRMMNREMFFFYCNSVSEENEIISEMRSILKKIVSEQYRGQGNNKLYLTSLYYELLHILTNDFLVNTDDKEYRAEEHKYDDRKNKIAEYVQQNYDRDISLKDLADKLFLSNAYLSKYIKRQFDMNFIEYVNSVRLNHAVSQLLYSDKPLVHIAMDNGFASSAALNKVFKEKYHMTPTEYRNRWRSKEGGKPDPAKEDENVRRQVTSYFTQNMEKPRGQSRMLEEQVLVNRVERRPLDKIWTKMINIGTAADLLDSDMQRHILYLKRTLHFRYVRFWDIHSPEIFMSDGGRQQTWNFDKIDRILDFLVRNELLPYIELRNKPKILIQNRTDRLQMRELDSEPDEELLRRFMKHLIIHLINRYSASEMEKWYFEIWKTEKDSWQNELEFAEKPQTVPLYLNVFDIIAGTLREYLPNIRIGGGGFALRWGEDHFLDILRQWKTHENLPDFLTIYAYPYNADTIELEKNQALDVDFIKKELLRTRELMAEADFPVRELHVTEWSFSVSSRNVLNDHCMKGAYLMKNMIDSIGLAEVMGYWVGSDLFADYYDSRWILNGGGGLISKDGIPKPAFYALKFMDSLGNFLLKTGEHCIVTDNGGSNYRIACHNLKSLGYQYGLMGEDKYIVEEVNTLFTDGKKLQLHFELPALKGGRYILRVYSINQKYGSILDNWSEMGAEEELTIEDVEYLERITVPRMVRLNCEEKNGKLRFDTLLEANEIQFIHITFRYT